MVVHESQESQKPREGQLSCSLQLLPLGMWSRSDDSSSEPLSHRASAPSHPVCISLRSQGKSGVSGHSLNSFRCFLNEYLLSAMGLWGRSRCLGVSLFILKKKLKYGVLIYRSTKQFSGEGMCVQGHLVCLGQNRDELGCT